MHTLYPFGVRQVTNIEICVALLSKYGWGNHNLQVWMSLVQQIQDESWWKLPFQQKVNISLIINKA